MHRHLTIALLAAAAGGRARARGGHGDDAEAGHGHRRPPSPGVQLIPSTRLNRLDVLAGDETIATYKGEALKVITVDPLILLDIPLRPGARVPAYLEHRISGRRTARVRVDRRAPIGIGPPLRGPNLGVLGCCGRPFAHRLAGASSARAARLPAALRDRLRAPRRLDQHVRRRPRAQRELLHLRLRGASQSRRAGSSRLAAACPRTRRPARRRTSRSNDLAGNFVNQDLGDGRFALYAHLQPGSVRVQPATWSSPDRCSASSATAATRPSRTCTSTSWTPPAARRTCSPTASRTSSTASGSTGRVAGLDLDPPVPARVPSRPPAVRTGEYPLTGDVISR